MTSQITTWTAGRPSQVVSDATVSTTSTAPSGLVSTASEAPATLRSPRSREAIRSVVASRERTCTKSRSRRPSNSAGLERPAIATAAELAIRMTPSLCTING